MTQTGCIDEILTAHYYFFRPADSELKHNMGHKSPLLPSFNIDNTVIVNKQYNLDAGRIKAGFSQSESGLRLL